MRNFKFLSEPDFSLDEMASWMWDDPSFVIINPDTQPYELVSEVFDGIHEFLRMFPPNYIVLVHEIRGLFSNITHNASNVGIGWGFNIQTDPIEITYYRFFENTTNE